MTIEQVKQDISTGKSKMVYYSTFTLWWSHLDADLEEATKQGKEATKNKIQELLKNPEVPEEDKKRMRDHLETIDESITPLDPSGSPLYQMENPIEWIKQAEAKPTHFGKNQLNAFIKTHHQNCNGWTPKSWDAVNEYLNRQTAAKRQYKL